MSTQVRARRSAERWGRAHRRPRSSLLAVDRNRGQQRGLFWGELRIMAGDPRDTTQSFLPLVARARVESLGPRPPCDEGHTEPGQPYVMETMPNQENTGTR